MADGQERLGSPQGLRDTGPVSMAGLSLLVSMLALAAAATGVVVALIAYRGEGPRIVVQVRPQAQFFEADGLPQCVNVKLLNRGRGAVTVDLLTMKMDRLDYQFNHLNTDRVRGPVLPVRLEGKDSEQWFLPIPVGMTPKDGKPRRFMVIVEVMLGSGEVVRSDRVSVGVWRGDLA